MCKIKSILVFLFSVSQKQLCFPTGIENTFVKNIHGDFITFTFNFNLKQLAKFDFNFLLDRNSLAFLLPNC